MQPYFFPYLGYWQLIDAVDVFVLFDEAQYIKQGWVNRNRILKPGGGWQYIRVPVAKHASTASIREVPIARGPCWKDAFLEQLTHYRRCAPRYEETIQLLRSMLLHHNDRTIGELNCRLVKQLSAALGIDTEIVVSSEHPFDYTQVEERGDWALVHALDLGANVIINPAGGIDLMSRVKLQDAAISLWSHSPSCVEYGQPIQLPAHCLSIVDVLMFKGLEGAHDLLAQRSIQKVY